MKLKTKADIKPKKDNLGLDQIASDVKNEIKPKVIKKKESKTAKTTRKKTTKKKPTIDINQIKKEILEQIKGENELKNFKSDISDAVHQWQSTYVNSKNPKSLRQKKRMKQILELTDN
ncbi:MAG: hypothetical protein ACTSPK_00070 [Candidatus Heimdallarchaeota archaeon]